ncbi:uncharacterized protein LOC134958036 [Pseudophryne corroboree]|uniref:uncharacterized protein LOC134958036 n=1 Tax=Pseudophryne corroboree TaxID=495146 RepID=UPI0030817507
MGTRFAPSYAKLCMAYWEDLNIFGVDGLGASLVSWHRYIDDVLFFWNGQEDELLIFTDKLNQNDFNLKFVTTSSLKEISFLDLCLYVEDDTLKTKTFRKVTDSNVYIEMGSLHHPNWLDGIPFSQFTRIKWNCSDQTICNEQILETTNRFINKGYSVDLINKARIKVENINRDDLLKEKDKEQETKNERNKWAFISQFNPLHKDIERIFRRNWYLLQKDPVIGKEIPDRPTFIYRKAPSLKDKLVRSAIDENTRASTRTKGFHRCGQCLMCRTVKSKSSKITEFTVNNDTYRINDFITCQSKNIIYGIECACGLLYVGRTSRNLKTHLAEHVYNIRKGLETHSLSAHFKTHHEKRECFIKRFWGIEQVKPTWRTKDLERRLAKNEMNWIFKLNSLQPKGLNTDFEMKWFL